MGRLKLTLRDNIGGIENMDYVKMFEDLHPGFFERDYIKRIPADRVYEEMVLELA